MFTQSACFLAVGKKLLMVHWALTGLKSCPEWKPECPLVRLTQNEDEHIDAQIMHSVKRGL